MVQLEIDLGRAETIRFIKVRQLARRRAELLHATLLPAEALHGNDDMAKWCVLQLVGVNNGDLKPGVRVCRAETLKRLVESRVRSVGHGVAAGSPQTVLASDRVFRISWVLDAMPDFDKNIEGAVNFGQILAIEQLKPEIVHLAICKGKVDPREEAGRWRFEQRLERSGHKILLRQFSQRRVKLETMQKLPHRQMLITNLRVFCHIVVPEDDIDKTVIVKAALWDDEGGIPSRI